MAPQDLLIYIRNIIFYLNVVFVLKNTNYLIIYIKATLYIKSIPPCRSKVIYIKAKIYIKSFSWCSSGITYVKSTLYVKIFPACSSEVTYIMAV